MTGHRANEGVLFQANSNVRIVSVPIICWIGIFGDSPPMPSRIAKRLASFLLACLSFRGRGGQWTASDDAITPCLLLVQSVLGVTWNCKLDIFVSVPGWDLAYPGSMVIDC